MYRPVRVQYPERRHCRLRRDLSLVCGFNARWEAGQYLCHGALSANAGDEGVYWLDYASRLPVV